MNIHNEDDTIRQIEDIIDIQKASGNYKFNTRQVVFNIPTECDSNISTVSKSLESGLAEKRKCKIKIKKLREKRKQSLIPDGITWPSDSDITVLRMKLNTKSEVIKENNASTLPGDGLHLPDSSSMVNLATLMLESQTPSKHSLSLEEYLLPLSSWESALEDKGKRTNVETVTRFNNNVDVFEALCTHKPYYLNKKEYDMYRKNTKSKLARFLRLYFCPCCTCLYKMEAMSEDPSVYCTRVPEIH